MSDSVTVTLTFSLPSPASSSLTSFLSFPKHLLTPSLASSWLSRFPTLTRLWLHSVPALRLPPTHKHSLSRFHTLALSVTLLAQFSSLRAQTTSPRRCLSNPVFHHSALPSLFSHSHHAISHHKSSNQHASLNNTLSPLKPIFFYLSHSL